MSNPTGSSTRKAKAIFGIGSGITEADAVITGAKLPTYGQVLRCLLYNIQDGAAVKRSKWDAAKLVYGQVVEFYGKANIPMISIRKACEKILKFSEENASIRAIPLQRRSSVQSTERIHQMTMTLEKTFPLWPAKTLINNPEDRAFLDSMMGDRAATFGQRDVMTANLEARRQMRADATKERALREEQRVQHDRMETAEPEVAGNNAAVAPPLALPPNAIVSPRDHHRSARTGTDAFIPYDILKRPSVISLASRMKMTPAQQAAFTSLLIEESGGDTSKVTTSYAAADRSRRSVNRDISSGIMRDWHRPELATLHWDSKANESLANQYVLEERLTVLVGTANDVKLLGIPSYQPGTDKKCGDIIAGLTVGLLEQWNCTAPIVNMTFDTTASNTGHLTAACIKIQERLGKHLLWSGCRHHVGEVLLSHLFDDLQIETSKSPDITVFGRFRKNFEMLPYHSADYHTLALFQLTEVVEPALTLLTECRESVRALATTHLIGDRWQPLRGDYREFVELCVAFLGIGDGTLLPTFSMKKPGAIHKARWMAKLLYSIKIVLFEHQIQQLPNGTITAPHQRPKLRAFVTFVAHVYSTWWMSCASVADAPWNDLKLIHLLHRYAVVDERASHSVLKAFARQLWYLTQEMVPLALFSQSTPTAERQQLAQRLLLCRPDTPMVTPGGRYGAGYGKPRFPVVSPTTTLADLAGPDSWLTFSILRLDASFLSLNVAEWDAQPSYQSSAANLRAIVVVNDCAERAVKLGSDFLSSARGEQAYQATLQVVEKDRKGRPDLRKRSKPE